ncbi:MAG: hypothetical protein BGO49_20235 [Planctomycetales bacterium 71-10]|nr:MAG: hypothetical protein BGO49_20235 [Planctomycetales bacterium 71-10]
MSKVFYRIVTEDFADEPGQRWPIDVLIQTEDPADFDRFEAAVEEALDRIQERIDREEDEGPPDEGYLDRLREKFGDSNCEGWDEYCGNVSQPEILLGKGDGYDSINLAGVAGRRRMRRMIEKGVGFEPYQLGLLRRLEGQAAVGKRVVKVKRKRLKPRVRPAMTLECVRIDPRLAEQFPGDFIRGLLARHRLSYQEHDWQTRRDGFSSVIGRHGRPDLAVYCLTVFFDAGNSITFASLLEAGERPDDSAVMERATVEFDSAAGTTTPNFAWSPESN